MKITLCTSLILISILTVRCNNKGENDNILLSEFDTPHETVPFDAIEIDDYLPALKHAINLAKEEIEQITSNEKEPDFVNTIEALDKVGLAEDRIMFILYNMLNVNTGDTLQQLSKKLIPMDTDFLNDIYLNEKLFARVRSVYQKKEQFGLNKEQRALLESTYQNFIRRGANLNEEEQKEYRRIMVELDKLKLTFDENLLKETNAYQLHLTNKKDIAGLTERAIEAAAQKARSRDLDGWVFTLQPPSYIPFMQNAENRKLREQMYKAWWSVAFHGNERDNSEIVRKIANLRLELANILGYNSFADYVLELRMAESTEWVNEFLDEMLSSSMPFAKKEYDALQQFAESMDDHIQLKEWDISYYSTKLKRDRFHIDDEMTRPYFEFKNVRDGIFDLANALYGISFEENREIPVYHPDVKAYEVFDTDGSFLAVLYLDFFPRENKRGGAWSSLYREQYKINDTNISTIATINGNFTEPTETKPSLLTIHEVNTFLHEFGHSLHSIFSDNTYRGTAKTKVYWDFIELPSQIMENWLVQKEWLANIATHYETGESIPDTLVENYMHSTNFMSGNYFRSRIEGSILDMAWHSITSPIDAAVYEFENNATVSTRLLPPVHGCIHSTRFRHIFKGAYAAGIYSYLWAEVLDADAFMLFKENGLFDKATAQSFRENILSKAATDHPMELYKRFRGREPGINALLERSGFVDDDSPMQ